MPSTFIVLLGAPLDADGSPGAWLSARIEASLQVFFMLSAQQPTPPPTFICSGASGEAEAMVRALTARGVPPANCILECRAKNTLENALRTREIVVQAELDMDSTSLPSSVVVCTSDFHMRRSQTIFRHIFGGDMGASAAASASAAATATVAVAVERHAAARPLLFVSAPDRGSSTTPRPADAAESRVGIEQTLATERELEQLQYRERMLLTHWWPAAQHIYSEEISPAVPAITLGAAVAASADNMCDVHPTVRDALRQLQYKPELTNARKAEELWSFIEDHDKLLRSHQLHGAKHGQRHQ